MKKLILIFFLLSSVNYIQAQVIKIDCCVDVGTKAVIIINNDSNSTNSSNTNSTSSSSSLSNNSFTFQLTDNVNTSAGVYNSDGVLVRTLWSSARYDAGCYEAQWDGLDDDGKQVAYGNYTIKVQTNKMQAIWEGGIGNTSDSFYNNQHKGMWETACFTANNGYYTEGYAERSNSHRSFPLNDIGKCYPVLDGPTSGDMAFVCAYNGTVYWAGFDPYSGSSPKPASQNFIFATKDSDGSQVTFANGQPVQIGLEGRVYSSCIDVSQTDYISTMSVSDKYLFVAYPVANKLHVLDRISGALLQNVSINNLSAIVCDNNNHIWLSDNSNNIVNQYSINSDGTITSTGLNVPGGSNVGLAISPVTGEIAVANEDTQQIKFYSGINGGLNNVLGQLNGYKNSPVVANNKFMLCYHGNGLIHVNRPNIAYQTDGSFWIADPGNFRNLHFNQDLSYKEQIDFLPPSRATQTCRNDSSRIFSGYLEFKRDYSKPLDNGLNGSWKLLNNWAGGLVTRNEYDGLFNIATFPNGKTYSANSYSVDLNVRFVELTSTGLRATGINLPDANIRTDGSLELANRYAGIGQNFDVTERALTGFDGADNPQWGPETPFVSIKRAVIEDPLPYNDLSTDNATPYPERHIFWRSGNDDGTTPKYHLGSVKRGTSSWEWQTTKGTTSGYIGDYPRDGGMDIGQGKQGTVSQVHVNGDFAFWSDRGELWKGGQINMWNCFNTTTGLHLLNFGSTFQDATLNNAYGFAGNNYSSGMTKVGSDFYIYHCDESKHGFVHSWKITGTNTVNIQSIPVKVTAAITTVSDPSDLMANVPFKSPDFYGNSIWTMNPSTNILRAGYGDDYPLWRVSTSKRTYQKNNIDIYFVSDDNTNGTIAAKLKNINTNNWILTGKIWLEKTNGKTTFNVLDKTEKAIFELNPDNGGIYVNGTLYPYGQTPMTYYLETFVFKCKDGVLSFKLANYDEATINTTKDSGADINTPSTFKINTSGTGDGKHSIGAVSEMKFQ